VALAGKASMLSALAQASAASAASGFSRALS